MEPVEQRLRDSLVKLADHAEVHVQADDVIGGARRIAHRRMVVGTTIGLVVAAAFGVIGWQTALPRPVTALPAPLATPSAPVKGSAVAYFGFAEEGATWQHSVHVRVESGGADWRFTVTQIIDGRHLPRHSYTTPAGQLWSSVVDENLALTVLPTATEAVAVDWPGLSIRQVFPAENLTVVAHRRMEAAPMETPPRVVWMDAGRSVHDSSGARLPSATATVRSSKVTVFEDGGAWGLFTDRSSYLPVPGDPTRKEIRLGVPSAAKASAGLLPAGARDIDFDAIGDTEYSLCQMPNGRIWFLALSEKGDEHPRSPWLVRSISYTDAAGVRHSYRPTVLPR